MPMEKLPLKVFLCHAHSDAEAVRALYDRLTRDGVDVWLDKANLIPGQDWEFEIRNAVRDSDVVIVCHSKQFNQRGFRQKEVKIALEEADLLPKGDIFIIPARLEECSVLDDLKRWHWVDLFAADGYDNLMRALRLRADHIGATLQARRSWLPKITTPRPKTEKPVSEKKPVIPKREKPEANAPAPAQMQPPSGAEADNRAASNVIVTGDGNVINVGNQEVSAPAAPKPEPARKPKPESKKINNQSRTAIIVAVITLVGTICAALASSPLVSNLFSRTPEPTLTVAPASAIPLPVKTKTPAPSLTPTKVFTPTVTPDPNGISDIDPAGNSISMRLVPAGTFSMGSETYDDEKPIHEVDLDAYYIDAYEVTNALYKACVMAGVCDPPKDTKSYTRSSYYGNSEFDDYPVIYVDWNMAKTYCDWRDAYLPTEAQWEKAARGTDERTYPWGEGLDCNKANYYDSTKSQYCVGDTTKVGSYESGKSPYGLYDMAGNVWEWVSSLYQPYPYSPTDGREDLSASGSRVLRGGSWGFSDGGVRSANRDYVDPSGTYYGVGFRCSRSLP